MRVGILPLGRPTFDVDYANEKLTAMLAALDATGHEITGHRDLLLDEDATRAAISELADAQINLLLVLQVTFTDAAMLVHAANTLQQPLAIWAVPEPRLGERLRLNAFCGLNLGSHALKLNQRDFSWLYADPSTDVGEDLLALLDGQRTAKPTPPLLVPAETAAGRNIAEKIKTRRIARIGEHPVGFDTCAYDADALRAQTGVEVTAYDLDALFDEARSVTLETASALRSEVDKHITGLDDVDQTQLDRSLRLKAGLDALRGQGNFDAFAIRCWPETFTEYGGAVCGPAAMMGEARVPCACEADVYGALTQLILMEAAQAPVFLTDLVDMDADDNTGVVWHCGQAPLSMRDPQGPGEATVHTNRKQPLLYHFALKPGLVTFLRISQSMGQPHIVLGLGEMLRRPMSYTGTSGVVRFERPAREVLDDIIASGLEHHMALAYGDHRDTLRGVAGAMNMPLLEI